MIPELAMAIDHTNPNNKVEDILNGDFVDTLSPKTPLSPTEHRTPVDTRSTKMSQRRN